MKSNFSFFEKNQNCLMLLNGKSESLPSEQAWMAHLSIPGWTAIHQSQGVIFIIFSTVSIFSLPSNFPEWIFCIQIF